MKKLEKLMSKWWFRLVLVAGFAAVLFLVNLILLTKAGDNGETHYANDGVLNITGGADLFCYHSYVFCNRYFRLCDL